MLHTPTTRQVGPTCAAPGGAAGALTLGCASAAPARTAPADSTEAVSVGYGSQAAGEVTGSVGVVGEERITRQRVTRVEELLQGRVPGVQVSRTANGDYAVRVRGAGSSSFVGSGAPLYVLDGVPITQSNAPAALAGISPQDVARIEVLKDAGATAIYGAQGSNGVILITTKRERRSR